MSTPPIKQPITGGSAISLLQSVSFYSPLLTMISILIFSVFSSALNKGLFYIASVFFVTAIRIFFLLYNFAPGKSLPNEKSLCNTGTIMPFTGYTYSTFLLTFTLLYFVTPMFILTQVNGTNMVNYSVIMFFVAYIIFDIYIKFSEQCYKLDIAVLGDFLVGGLFGALMAVTLFYSDKISLLFINELNSNKEVCTVPSKQQFKCQIFRNGTIVGSSVSA